MSQKTALEICKECGTRLRPNALFCHNCGTRNDFSENPNKTTKLQEFPFLPSFEKDSNENKKQEDKPIPKPSTRLVISGPERKLQKVTKTYASERIYLIFTIASLLISLLALFLMILIK
ncbi:MAG: zinc ribbon domain-containing protein [Acidobacteriota bacterium]|nr:zinc ribbon domain-containing protein [Pyrinomonadaceae bacterium]MDW8303796.1 zinc ribbon domain-containing protein [Acidobacteriota bacterium]